MRFLARLIGVIALAGAFAAAVIDGARWIAAGDWAPTSTGAALYALSPKALAGTQSFVESHLGVWAWDDVLFRALLAPAFVVLTILSALFFIVSRTPPPRIGRSSRDR
ncbi:MAG: hypothetical protein JO223_01960 [Hyphomicrobiales bacterium]|nr:hypothetical protein [Hyphomicrobiales bacterium]MBV8442168.1 hypothetical protein [Hyphomicrobiales bacterium]